jgi:hypothetical protein
MFFMELVVDLDAWGRTKKQARAPARLDIRQFKYMSHGMTAGVHAMHGSTNVNRLILPIWELDLEQSGPKGMGPV